MKSLAAALSFALALTAAASAQAQSDYPSRPITLVITQAAGGGMDGAARYMARKLSDVLGQSVVVENKPGGSENIATTAVAKASPDGYTLLMCSNGITVNPSLYKSLPYDIKDLRPIARVATTPLVIAAQAAEPYNSVAEMVAYAKANPAKLSYGSPGLGTPHHMTMELLKSKTGAPIQHVPYRGAAPGMNDLLAGVIPILVASTLATEPHIKSGKVKALVMINNKRWPGLDNVPTLGEAMSGLEVDAWMAILAPAGIPKAIEVKLSQAFKTVLGDSEVIAQMTRLGAIPSWLSPDDLAATMDKDTVRWAEVVKSAGIKAE